jgi:phenylacetate-CoA ligase
MDALALAIRHAVFPAWVLKNRSARLRYLAQLEKSQFWTARRLHDHQWAAFKRMLAHAVGTCPFYREKFSAAGLEVADLRSPEDILAVPTLSKEEIQDNRDAMISADFRKETLLPDMTGGSTGSPMRFFYDTDRRDSREAAALRHDRWSGWNIGDRRAVLWGAPQDTEISQRPMSLLREHLIDRRLLLDASSLDERSMESFARRLVEYRPVILQAYANTLGLFARFVDAQRIAGIMPRGIITSAEVLTDETRALVERVFRCRIYDRYGCREFGVIASQCGEHAAMHINAENLLVEAVPGGELAKEGQGEIVITDLRNFAMPMIRYRIKDVGSIKAQPCSCSRGLPLLQLSGGRVTDFLTAKNGRKVSGIVLATYVITNITGVRQVQFVQSEPDAVAVNIVKGPLWSQESLTQLLARGRSYLGEDMRFDVAFKDHIAFEKSGKYRFAISNIKSW